MPPARRRSVEALRTAWLLLLTGTPIQNNMQELFSIMNLVAPARVHDLAAFLAAYGDPPRTPSSPAQLQALQARPSPAYCPRSVCVTRAARLEGPVRGAMW